MTDGAAHDLLDSCHDFPAAYTIKVIGKTGGRLADQSVRAARSAIGREVELEHSERSTPQGKHVSVTLEWTAHSSDEIVRVYRSLQMIPGVTMLL